MKPSTASITSDRAVSRFTIRKPNGKSFPAKFVRVGAVDLRAANITTSQVTVTIRLGEIVIRQPDPPPVR